MRPRTLGKGILDIQVRFELRYDAWTIEVSIIGHQKACGIFVDGNERPIPWWNLKRKWGHRQYRRRLSEKFAYRLKWSFGEVDQKLEEALKEQGVTLV